MFFYANDDESCSSSPKSVIILTKKLNRPRDAPPHSVTPLIDICPLSYNACLRYVRTFWYLLLYISPLLHFSSSALTRSRSDSNSDCFDSSCCLCSRFVFAWWPPPLFNLSSRTRFNDSISFLNVVVSCSSCFRCFWPTSRLFLNEEF